MEQSQKQKLEIVVPFSKSLMDSERRLVTGVVSASSRDIEGDSIDWPELKRAMVKMWDGGVDDLHSDKYVGTKHELRFDDDEEKAYLTTHIFKKATTVDGDDLWEAIEQGKRTGYSIEAYATGPMHKDGRGLHAKRFLTWDGVGIVDRPAHPEALFKSMVKRLGDPVDMTNEEMQPDVATETVLERAAEIVAEKALAKKAREKYDESEGPFGQPGKDKQGEKDTWPLKTVKEVRAAISFFNDSTGEKTKNVTDKPALGKRIAAAASSMLQERHEYRDGKVVPVAKKMTKAAQVEEDDELDELEETPAPAKKLRKAASEKEKDPDHDGDDDTDPEKDTDDDEGEEDEGKQVKKRAPSAKSKALKLTEEQLERFGKEITAPLVKRLAKQDAEIKKLRAQLDGGDVVSQLVKQFKAKNEYLEEKIDGLEEEVDDMRRQPMRGVGPMTNAQATANLKKRNLRTVDREEEDSDPYGPIDAEAAKLVAYDEAIMKIDAMGIPEYRKVKLRKQLQDRFELRNFEEDLDSLDLEKMFG